jgi:hypothetical protein
MSSLILPNRVTVQLVDHNNSALRMANVLLRVHLFARRKNDFHLQPFASDNEGLVTILKKDLEAEVAAHYDSGLMDYAHVSDCMPTVEIRLLSTDETGKAIEARQTWKDLLAGERDRWTSIDQLLVQYEKANNRHLLVAQSSVIRADWQQERADCFYTLIASLSATPK